MNTTTATAVDTSDISPTDLGKKFVRWGLNLYITGFLAGLVPVLHYMHGAVAGDIGGHFMKNMTLWWGCPAVLMELTLKTGGLGMLVVGLCYIVLSQGFGTTSVERLKCCLLPKADTRFFSKNFGVLGSPLNKGIKR
jgi:hypothetical protein